MNETSKPVLHVFCDASAEAYGAVVYIVNDKNSSFIMAKSCIVPQHAEACSILRKELIAVLEDVRIAIKSVESCEGIF